MNKIGLIYNLNSPRVEKIKPYLQKEFEILEAHDYEETLTLLHKHFEELSNLVIDNPANKGQIKGILKLISNINTYMFSLPVVILTDPENMELDDDYLKSPAVSLISTADTETVIMSRIRNSIRFSNSTSFDDFSNMLSSLPSLVYVKDTNGRYAFCSKRWHHFASNESIRGKTDFEIRKNFENAKIAVAADKEVVRTGQGKDYLIKEISDEGVDYLQIIKEPLKNSKGEVYGIIAIINNVTDQELLRQELRAKSITDQLTGLYNRSYFEEFMDKWPGETTFPVTIVSADCDDLTQINDAFGHGSGDKYICYTRDALHESLPEGSLLFRMGGDEFLAVVPNTNKKQAEEIVN